MSLFRRDRGYRPYSEPLTDDDRVERAQQQAQQAHAALRDKDRQTREQTVRIAELEEQVSLLTTERDQAKAVVVEIEEQFAELMANSAKLVFELQTAWWMRAATAANRIIDIGQQTAHLRGFEVVERPA